MCDVSEWTTSQVGMWLQVSGFSQYADLFCVTHKIDGVTLLTLTESDLRSSPLEISVLGDIKKLMIKINKLKLENRETVEGLGLCDSDTSMSSPRSRISEFQNHVTTERLESESSTYSDLDDLGVDKCGVLRRYSSRLAPDYTKWILSFLYMFSVFLLTAIVMVIVHDRVPDMKKYPPLPDIVLDNMPYVPWAFDMCEITALLLMAIWMLILVFHKHRFILMRRWFALTGTVFLLRCVTMLITSLSVPGTHLECQPKVDGDMWSKFYRALVIWKGFGMSLQGVRTCGDYMFSGHTVIVTMINFFITEYSPRRMHLLHTAAWVLNLFGIFFILAAHEHYSLDVFVAFYITSRLFLYYHSLANNRALKQPDYKRTRIWFPLFYLFESHVDGMVPNEYEWPSLWPRSFNLSLFESKKEQ